MTRTGVEEQRRRRRILMTKYAVGCAQHIKRTLLDFLNSDIISSLLSFDVYKFNVAKKCCLYALK